MPNRFQIKRTTTSGLLPNVSNSSNTSYIAAGELAINLTDRKLLSSNGSATFEIGANLASISVGGALTGNSTGLYHTGTINAASFTVGATVVANSTAVFATRLNSKTEGNLNVNNAVTSGAVTVTDTRAAQTTPETLASPLVDFDFKQNTTEGLSDGGTYFGEMTFRPYGTTTDWTGGPSHQLGFTSNNNVYHRNGTSTSWGAWARLYKEGTVLAAGNTTITGFVNVSTTATIGTGFTLTSGNANFDSGVLFVDGTNNRVGVNNTTPAHALSVTGTLFAGNTTINGDLAIGGVDAGPNFISFRGTTGDSPQEYTHTYIGERIHTASEASELFLFKGNDPLSSAGPDRVRIGAAEFRVDTYTSVLSGTFETVASSANLTNRFIITNAGNVGIGNSTPSSKLVVAGAVELGNTTVTGFANVTTTATIGTGFTLTSGNANFDSGVLFVDGTNNRVGIGNTTPAHALSVTGTTNLGGVVTITSNATLSGTNTHITSTNTSITSNVTISGTLAAGNTTVTGFANVSGIVSADYYTASNNGNGTNYRIGDDAWLGDINSADTVGLKGQQNASYGYIKFGAAPTSLGYNGTSLIYSSNVSFGNTSVTGFINVSSTAQFGSTVRIANDQRLVFTANSTNPTHASKLVHQADDNFVFYSSSTTGTERAIWSVFSNSNTSVFQVSTAITATGDITAFFSDDRLKDRYSNIPNAVEKVKSLNGFYYEPNITAQDLGYQKEMHVGVSAQEVNAIMPEIVAPAPIDNKYMTVKYDRLIPLLIEAIKEQQIQIDELKAQLKKD